MQRHTIIFLLILTVLLGCATRQAVIKVPPPPPLVDVAPPNADLEIAGLFVASVVKALPNWKADTTNSYYEQAEIATVEADLKVCRAATSDDAFITAAEKLQDDWNLLTALDKTLKLWRS